jgi:putative sigma-54 modulation protein
MNVEYTGRQAVITDELRALAGPFLDRMEKMLGRGTSAHVVMSAEKHRQIAEVTVKTQGHDLVGLCESTASQESALRQALEKTEAQAIRFKEKRKTQKRLPKDEKATVELALARPGKSKRTGLLETTLPAATRGVDELASSLAARSKVAKAKSNGAKSKAKASTGEPHVTRAIDAVALRPMSLEEAIKEMETRNRELFVFRDRAGLLRILHCRLNGKLELIELP